MRNLTRRPGVWVVVGLLAVLSACRGDTDDGDGVASVERGEEGGEIAGDVAPDREADPAEVEDSFVEFGGCLRDEGMDELAAEAEEGTISDPHPSLEAKYPGYEAAYEACIPIVEAVTGSMEMTAEEIAHYQDRALAQAQCMRERGHDYPDPVFGEDGFETGAPEVPELSPEEMVRELNECAEQVRDEIPGPYDE